MRCGQTVLGLSKAVLLICRDPIATQSHRELVPAAHGHAQKGTRSERGLKLFGRSEKDGSGPAVGPRLTCTG